MDAAGILHSLNGLSQSMARAGRIDDLLWQVTNHCSRFLQLDDFVIYTRKEKANSLIQSAAHGAKCHSKNAIANPLELPIGTGIVGMTALTQKPLLVNDTRQNAHYLVDGEHRLSELAVPIIWKDTVIGVIDSEHQHRGFFSSTYVDAFCLIANLCAPFMHQLIQKDKKKISADNKHFEELLFLFDRKNIHRDKSLSLQSTAKELGISAVYLSNIVNQISGQSFSYLVNKYRIRDVQQSIRKGQHQCYNLLALAYQAGFNSKSSFNYNFKLHTQQTPSDFIKRVKL
ncbi:MAG: helix-turn-helix domain-containing protein [Bacteroidota bacterium]